MLNRVILVGKVQRAELDFTQEGLTILRITLRTWDTYETQFHNLVYFDSTGEKAYRYAEILNNPEFNGYLFVEGQIRYRTYTAKDGTTRRITNIMIRNMKIISPKNGISERKEEKPETEKTQETLSSKNQKDIAEIKGKKPAVEDIITPEIEEIEKELAEIDDSDIPF